MYVNRFFSYYLNTTNLNPDFTVLGDTAKENELLEYCQQNNIKHLILYDVHKILRSDPSLNAINNLCTFIDRAKNDYCVNTIGIAGTATSFFCNVIGEQSGCESPQRTAQVSLTQQQETAIYNYSPSLHRAFTDSAISENDTLFAYSEFLKFYWRIAYSPLVCPGLVDFFSVDAEFWNVDEVSYTDFTTLIQQLLFINSHFSASMQVEVYLGFPTASQGQHVNWVNPAGITNFLDGCSGTGACCNELKKADRINLACYTDDADTLYELRINSNGLSREDYFRDPCTNDRTVIHPLFSAESVSLGTYDFLGKWFREGVANNIFTAERIFYDDFMADNIHTASENVFTPGACLWFTSSFMTKHLNNPIIFNTNSPVCTNTSNGNVVFNYQGPIDTGIGYAFTLQPDPNSYSFGDINTTFTNSYNGTPQIQFPVCNLPVGTYTATLTLAYPGCTTYSYSEVIEVTTTPAVTCITPNPQNVCEGDQVVLKASSGDTYQWYRNGILIPGATNQDYVATLRGLYSCDITHLTVSACASGSPRPEYNLVMKSNPQVSILTPVSCPGNTGPQLIADPQVPGATYHWNTGETTASIIALTSDKYWVTVTNPSGCQSETRYKVVGIPMEEVVLNQSGPFEYCQGMGTPVNLEAGGGQGVYHGTTWIGSDQSVHHGWQFNNVNPNQSVTYTARYDHAYYNGCYTESDPVVFTVHPVSCPNSDLILCQSEKASDIVGTYQAGISVSILSDFIVDQSFTFDQSDVYLDPGVKIVVSPGVTLTITNQSVLQACGAHWQGIVLSDPSASVVIRDGSTIRDAIIGIDASNDALVEIRNSSFSNNGIGVFLHDGIFSNFISDGSSYSGTSSFSPNHGIKLENAADVLIGDPSMALNTFLGFTAGIFVLKSNLEVKNCAFNNNVRPCNFQSTDCYPGQGSGILAQGDASGVYQLNVGGVTGEGCYFNDNTYGVYTKTNVQLSASHNTFNNISYINPNTSYGIYGIASSGAVQNVSENIFNRLDYGVWFSNIHDAEMIIDHNSFNDFIPVPARQGSRAITVWSTNPFGNSWSRSIRNNNIQHYMQGISLTHQQGIAVEENQFHFDLVNPVSLWYGVRILGGTENIIRLNSMNRTGTAPDLGLSRQVMGISIERSENNLIAENNIFNLGSGIRFYSTTISNAVKCNQLIQSVDNLVLENALIGDQGSPNSASDNFWLINPNTEQTSSGHGNILNIGNAPNPRPIFYVQDLPGFNPDFNGVGDCPYVCPGYAANIDKNANPGNSCSNSGCNDPQCYQDLIAQIIDEQVQYADLPDEQNEKARNFAFELLIRDSMLMYQGTLLDAKLRDFYIEMKEGNSGIFEQITNLLQEEDNQTASIVNSTITPENLSESNLQLFNEMFLGTWAEHNFELNAYIHSILEFIAYQNPYSGGDAVYCARVMLGLDIADFISIPEERRRAETESVTFFDQGLIVPNPNTGKMSYIYTNEYEDNSEFQIFNNRGKLIKSYTIEPDIKSLDIDLSDQPGGIYIYRIVTNGKVFSGNKIILQK